jgi:anti-sigma factor RsiW
MNFTTAKLASLVRSEKDEMRCPAVRQWLPGYLDGALPDGRGGAKLHARMARHLERCAGCRAELKSYQALSRVVMEVPGDEPPEELAVSIRLAVARAREASGMRAFAERCRHRLDLLIHHVLEPLLIPVTGGALVALIVFGFVFPILGGGLYLPGIASRPDLPTSLMQPARLETLAGFPLPGLEDASGTNAQGLLVEATVNSDGQAVGYRVIGAQLDAGTQRQLDRVVLFSRFRPQMSFGKPTSSGRVVLGFSRIFVRG